MRILRLILAQLSVYGMLVSDSAEVLAESSPTFSAAAARELSLEWVKLEQTISQESRDWSLQRAGLDDLIELYELEMKLITEELDAAGEVTLDLDQKAEQLKNQTLGYQKGRSALEKKTLEQGRRLAGIALSFPEPLKAQLSTELLVIDDSKSSLRERVTAIVSILKAAGKFNRAVTYAEQEQEVGGAKRQLRVLYLGLGQGYFLSGDQAGIGQLSEGVWSWKVVEGTKSAISKAMAVHQRTARPELITLPVQMQ